MWMPLHGLLGSEPKAVEYVTAENKDEYDIHDVVLPLPGYDILLPDNAGMYTGGHYIGVEPHVLM